MKSAIVIFDTKFGNTEKIAKSLAEGMMEQGITVDYIKVGEVDVSKLNDYDLVAIGGPTHMFGISKPIKDLLRNFEEADLKSKKAFAFDTKYKGKFIGSAGKGIEKKLKQLQMEIIKPHLSGIVKGSKGPLEEGTVEKFKQTGADLAKE